MYIQNMKNILFFAFCFQALSSFVWQEADICFIGSYIVPKDVNAAQEVSNDLFERIHNANLTRFDDVVNKGISSSMPEVDNLIPTMKRHKERSEILLSISFASEAESRIKELVYQSGVCQFFVAMASKALKNTKSIQENDKAVQEVVETISFETALYGAIQNKLKTIPVEHQEYLLKTFQNHRLKSDNSLSFSVEIVTS